MSFTSSNEGQISDDSDKTVGILAYITIIGLIVGIILNSDKKGEEKKFGAFHLRQSLGLAVLSFGIYLAISLITGLLFLISESFATGIANILNLAYLVILVLAILGIIYASNGVYKELPVIGKYSSKILRKTFE